MQTDQQCVRELNQMSQGLYQKCDCTVQGDIPETAITVVRKSFDARKELKWVYIVDVDTAALTAAGVRNTWMHPKLKERCGRGNPTHTLTMSSTIRPCLVQYQNIDTPFCRPEEDGSTAGSPEAVHPDGVHRHDPVVVVGSGPAGLFAALALAEAGIQARILPVT